MDLSAQPRWVTGPRLLKLGESFESRFSLPAGLDAGELEIFPLYLEQGDPGEAFVPGGSPDWIDALKCERLPLEFVGGHAHFTYVPARPGNYRVRWRAGGEAFYRHFAVIEDDWIVLRFSTFGYLEAEPTLHAAGLPLDYRLPLENFRPGDALLEKLSGYARHFGDAVIPVLPNRDELTIEERTEAWRRDLAEVKSLLPEPESVRSIRLEGGRRYDPGYVESCKALGLSELADLSNANAPPWLGMPEFPYFASPLDWRKPRQGTGAGVVAHQWDFCGSFHFLGPVTWHYTMSRGDWQATEHCLREGIEEAKNLTLMSGHPAFFMPLYDGVREILCRERWEVIDGFEGVPMPPFVERYQRQMAFGFPREYKLAFARSIDVADYYRRHFRVTPRTVFVSSTDHIFYDMGWLCHWFMRRELITKQRIPWQTQMSHLMKLRRTPPIDEHGPVHTFKDPLSCEYILIEDQRRQLRFERECPNPVWWFDYADQLRGPNGSEITHEETPDVLVIRSGWQEDERGRTMVMTMKTEAQVEDYAIALWGIPMQPPLDRSRIETDATDFMLAFNTAGEVHMVLFFVLRPGARVTVTVRGS